MKKFIRNCALLMLLLIACVFALASCTDSPDVDEQSPNSPDMLTSYTENASNINWTIHYYSVSREISFINASYTENDRSSTYWEFSRNYHGDSTIPVKHSVSLKGVPVGDGWFKIEQTEEYIMSASSVDDLERVKKTFPSCTQDPYTLNITLSKRTTRYEEKFAFSLPVLDAKG